MRMWKSLLSVLMALLSASVIAAPAVALQPGVTVNPNSPASKEYSFPLDVLRASALGRAAPQGVAQPLFGVGIGAVTAGGGTSSASARRAGEHGIVPGPPGAAGTTGGHTGTAGHSTRGSSRAVPPRELASLLQPQSPTTQVMLLALIVLLAGALLGVAIVAAQRRG